MGLLNEDQLNDIMSNVHVCDEDWFEELLLMWNDRQTTKQVQIKGNKMKIEIKKLDEKAVIPEYATEKSAAVDLRANINKAMTLDLGETVLIPTGLAINIYDGEVAALILPRSGLGHSYGIKLGNSVGLIDADYNKELFVSIKNTGTGVYKINPQDRIAQMMFIPIIHVEFEEVNEFSSETDRGGFGSTGV
jgi:dUTP pyrophosphatase